MISSLWQIIGPLISWKNIGIAVGVILAGNYVIKKIKSYFINQKYDKLIADVLAERTRRLDSFMEKYPVDLNDQRVKDILNSNATVITAMIKNKEVTSVELVKIFANQIYANLDLNLIADVNFEKALSDAEEKDRITETVPADEVRQ